MKYRTKAIIAGIVICAAAVLFIMKLPASEREPIAWGTGWTKGNPSSTIVLTEYSDFQCPACGIYKPVVEKLAEEFAADILVEYRHFPLGAIHPYAELAARAAEAAGTQGKFWEMHDLLFERQQDWPLEADPGAVFAAYVRDLGLDEGAFLRDLNSADVRVRVDADYASGVRAGVNATPTFFVNGRKITNPRSYEEFSSIIKKAISTN